MKGGSLLAYTVVVCLCGVCALRGQETSLPPAASQAGAAVAGSPSVAESVVPRLIRFDGVVKDAGGRW